MSSVTSSTNIQQVKPDDVPRFVDIALQNIVRVINGGLDFGNFNGRILEVTFPVSTVEQTIPHGLGRVPTYYVVLGRSAPGTIYDGATAWTSTNIYLKAGGVQTARLFII